MFVFIDGFISLVTGNSRNVVYVAGRAIKSERGLGNGYILFIHSPSV